MFQPVKKKRVADAVYEQILEMIIKRELVPGERLDSERDIAIQMNCSRTAVREALKMLEKVGVIETFNGVNGGSFIKKENTETIGNSLRLMLQMGEIDQFELVEARKALETIAVQYAVERATKEDIDKLKQNIIELEKNSEDHYFRIKNNHEFHEMIFLFSRNKILLLCIQALMVAINRTFEKIVQDETAVRELISSHKKIVEAIEKKNVKLAQEEMVKHIKLVERSLEIDFS